MLTVYTGLTKEGAADRFNSVFEYVLLLIPLVTLPFAFTQQNEEIIVRQIGEHLGHLKKEFGDASVRDWEQFHGSTRSVTLLFTSAFRASLLIIFSFLSFVFAFIRPLLLGEGLAWFRQNCFRIALGAIDFVLIGGAVWVSVSMARTRIKQLSQEPNKDGKN
jgi:hypothetical protein